MSEPRRLEPEDLKKLRALYHAAEVAKAKLALEIAEVREHYEMAPTEQVDLGSGEIVSTG